MITIFICIDWFLPAYKAGGPIQSIANLIQHFSNKVSYKIFCSNTDVNGQALHDVEYDKWITFNSYTQVWYTSSKRRSIKVLSKQFKNSGADVLFINGIYSWQFNLVPLLFCKAKRKIVSARGMLHPEALSQKRLKKKIYLFFWKILQLHRHCYFHASDKIEKKYIENIFGPACKIFIAQNFPKTFRTVPSPEKKQGKLQLISIALISPMKNILPVLNALQFCDQCILYNIYGSVKDEIYWQKCIKQIKNLPENISVKYYGDISPDMVEAELGASHVFILPSKSENFGHAIYEALSAGKPVITSNTTPWNNLRQNRAGININTDINEIINSILFFASMEQQEFLIWQSGASRYASNAININDIKQQYVQMFLS